MKLFICTVLLLAVSGIWGMPTDSDEDENDFGERKYGLGVDLGGSFKGGAEVGIHASNGTYSLFANKAAKGRVNAGIGVYKSVKPYVPNPGQEANPGVQYNPQYPPQYPQPMYQPYPVPGNGLYPQYPQPMYQPYPVPGNGPSPLYQPFPPLYQPYNPYPQYGFVPVAAPEQAQTKQ